MRLAMKLPPKGANGTVANDSDPRDETEAEIIDLAQHNAYPAVARKGKSDGMGMVAGIAIVAGLGAVTLWSMNAARVAEPEGIGGQQVQQAAPAPVAQPVAAPSAVAAPAQQPAMQGAPAPQAVCGSLRATAAPARSQ